MKHSVQGVSLVELMVALVIGMLGVLAIMHTYTAFEGQKRTTTAGGDAQQAGALSIYALERNIRMAGMGISLASCDDAQIWSGSAVSIFDPWPLTIARNTPAVGSDTITVTYGYSSLGGIPMRVESPMADSDAALVLKNASGIVTGDLLLIYESGKDCTILQASGPAVLASGVWTVPHVPGSGFTHIPPAGTDIFPTGAGGYSLDARVVNLGKMRRISYSVIGTDLVMLDLLTPGAVPVAIANNVMGIRAQYGRDTGSDGFVDVYDVTAPARIAEVGAINVSIITASAQAEVRDAAVNVTSGPVAYWPGGTLLNGNALSLDVDYRYKIYRTTIPLRNVLWNN